jgi:hypothetical protein
MLHKNSRNIDLDDIGNLNTTVFIQDAFPEIKNRHIEPTDLMDHVNHLVINKILLDYFTQKEANIGYEPACFITKDDTYYEDYWIIEPKTEREIISLEKSEFTVDIIDKNYPFLNDYYFTKIIKSDIKIQDPIFTCKYLNVICINQETLEFIQKNKLKGLSFLEIEKYETWKTVEKHEDHIII